MAISLIYRATQVALLFVGSAILLIACDQKNGSSNEENAEKVITQQSDSLTITNSENGFKSYRFSTPLMEYYEQAKEPYREFRKGIHIETYKDSSKVKESSLVADYAIFFEKQKLWEAKGNVVAVNAEGQILETQQLFWNQKTKRIYSNVDSKVTTGADVIVGEGFESNEAFDDFTFRQIKGKVGVNVTPADSASQANASQPAAMQPVPGPVKSPPSKVPTPFNQTQGQPQRPGNPLVKPRSTLQSIPTIPDARVERVQDKPVNQQSQPKK